MTHSLWEHLDRVKGLLSARPFGLFTDMDGTISEMASTPQEAVVGSSVRRALARLSQTLELVVVLSGRAAQDAHQMVGLDEVVYVGNHGLEMWEGGRVRVWQGARPYVPIMDSLITRLVPWLRLPGVALENKGVALAIHYRGASDPEKARRGIRRILEEAEVVDSFQVTEGKRVIEVKPPVGVDKGVALRQLVEDRGLRGALVLGDDRTDMDAFREMRALHQQGRLQGAAVAVVGPESPVELAQSATFTLQGVAEVERLLRWLAQSASR